MPSKNMLPKGKRRQTVKHEYRAHRTLMQEREATAKAAGEAEEAAPTELIDTAGFAAEAANGSWIITTGANGSKVAAEVQEAPRYTVVQVPEPAREIKVLDDLEAADGVRRLTTEAAASGMRLDAFLAKAIPGTSRGRVQLLIEHGQITVNGAREKASLKLRGGEEIEIEGEPRPEPLHATPEDLPLSIVYEDEDIAVIDKTAGMTVHAGAGSTDDARNRGTLVNALLFHFGQQLSSVGGEARPGLVHRLDKETSGLIVVAKNDLAHRRLAEIFAARELRKIYITLVHGWLPKDEGTIDLPISRDLKRRTRMTTRRADGRRSVSHWRVLERIDSPFGRFTLLEVRIETGRTHQIRVHLQALGYSVVGDTLYGAPHRLSRTVAARVELEEIWPDRNFLHAAELDFDHPRTHEPLQFRAALPSALETLLQRLRE